MSEPKELPGRFLKLARYEIWTMDLVTILLIGLGVSSGIVGICAWSAAATIAWLSAGRCFMLWLVSGSSKKELLATIVFATFLTYFIIHQWTTHNVCVHWS